MDWITVASFLEPWEAHLFRLRLEAEDIPAHVAHEHHVWVNWSLGTALGGVKVQVLSGSEDRAQEILRLCAAGEFRRLLQTQFDDLDDPQCPVCHSPRVRRHATIVEAATSVFMMLVSGHVLPPFKSGSRCGDCDARWRAARD